MYTAPYATEVSRAERAFSNLKARILAGEFALGQRLGETRLAEMLGVSRTPIREALHRLHADGLVTRHPEGGFLPYVPDIAMMRPLYEARIGLELLALRRPSALGTVHAHADLEALRDEWAALGKDEPEPSPDFVVLDESFHLALASAGGNPVVVDLLRSVNERIRIVRMQDFLTAERVSQTISQHLGIVEAVLCDDVLLAVACFEQHLSESLAVVEERAMRAISRMIAAKEGTP